MVFTFAPNEQFDRYEMVSSPTVEASYYVSCTPHELKRLGGAASRSDHREDLEALCIVEAASPCLLLLLRGSSEVRGRRTSRAVHWQLRLKDVEVEELPGRGCVLLKVPHRLHHTISHRNLPEGHSKFWDQLRAVQTNGIAPGAPALAEALSDHEAGVARKRQKASAGHQPTNSLRGAVLTAAAGESGASPPPGGSRSALPTVAPSSFCSNNRGVRGSYGSRLMATAASGSAKLLTSQPKVVGPPSYGSTCSGGGAGASAGGAACSEIAGGGALYSEKFGGYVGRPAGAKAPIGGGGALMQAFARGDPKRGGFRNLGNTC